MPIGHNIVIKWQSFLPQIHIKGYCEKPFFFRQSSAFLIRPNTLLCDALPFLVLELKIFQFSLNAIKLPFSIAVMLNLSGDRSHKGDAE